MTRPKTITTTRSGGIIFLILVAGACIQKQELVEARSDVTGLAPEELTLLVPISKGIEQASSLILLEGLPHPVWDDDQLKHELATKNTIRILDFPFYEQPLPVAAKDIERLRRLSSSPTSYRTYVGPKDCGGYHPDYCLSWQHAGETYRLLICLGCHEMKIASPDRELQVDINDNAFEQFKSILKGYRDQRPKSSW